MELKIDKLNTAIHSLEYLIKEIPNFFNNRNTNANAESFNAKIKNFRANLSGVTDVKFFLFRLEKLFA
jgi:transposase